MKKNLYYRHVYKRRNALWEFVLHTFLSISSGPRLLLEVFIRRNMGERYFSLSTGIFIALALAFYPMIASATTNMFGARVENSASRYLTWYLFIPAFLYFCHRRSEEIKRLPSVFDFARFSLSTGEINLRFYQFERSSGPNTVRRIETLIEPLTFGVIGFILMVADQALGGLLILCSIIYSLSYMAAYKIGDDFVMDKIDEMLCNEEMVNSFVDGFDPTQTRGVKYYGRRPADPDIRRKLVDSFMEDDDDDVAEAV